MTDVQIEVGDLFANVEERTISGLLVPYGEVGNTNLGKFEIPKGTAQLPLDASIVTLNLDHSRENPVGRTATLTDTDKGVTATFSVAKTPEGDAALADAADPNGKRKKLSVEMTGIVLRAGKLVSGRIFGAALVEKGAFPSASLLAADVGEDPEAPTGPTTTTEKTSGTFIDEHGVEHKTTVTTITTVDGDVTTIKETTVIDEPGEPATEKEPPVAIPNTLTAGDTKTPAPVTLRELGEMLYASKSGRLPISEIEERLAGQNMASDNLFAALSDVKYNGTGGLLPSMALPQWLDEVKLLTRYKQFVLPLFTHADLTALSLQGYKWTTKPDGGDFAGNKGNVPSNTLVVAAVTATATAWALGHDIAREFVDFPVPGFFEAYAAAVLESYQRWADTKVATAVVAGATALAADLLATIPGNPVATTTNIGGTIGTTASAIIDGAAVLVSNNVLPDFALVAPALWKQMVKIPKNNVMGYLNAALGLSEGELDGFVIRPSAQVAAGKVLVGARQAVTVYELPNAPIRIDALDLARGGVDKAAFGYLGVVINDPTALQLVTAATA